MAKIKVDVGKKAKNKIKIRYQKHFWSFCVDLDWYWVVSCCCCCVRNKFLSLCVEYRHSSFWRYFFTLSHKIKLPRLFHLNVMFDIVLVTFTRGLFGERFYDFVASYSMKLLFCTLLLWTTLRTIRKNSQFTTERHYFVDTH